jgi:hypothetical protein
MSSFKNLAEFINYSNNQTNLIVARFDSKTCQLFRIGKQKTFLTYDEALNYAFADKVSKNDSYFVGSKTHLSKV